MKPLNRVTNNEDALILNYKSGRVMKIHKDDILAYNMDENELVISLPTGYKFNVSRGVLTNYDEAIVRLVQLKGLR